MGGLVGNGTRQETRAIAGGLKNFAAQNTMTEPRAAFLRTL